MSDFFTGSICLEDIPEEFKTKANNGKTYVNFAISKRKEASKFGETHTIYVSKPKDQRKDGEQPTFIGGAKAWSGSPQQSQGQTSATPKEDDQMPF